MNEEPRSFWKKALSLPQLLLVWLVMLAGTMLAVLIVVLIINAPFPIAGLLIVSAVTATVLLGLWILVRWLFNRCNYKRSLFGLACFITLIAIFYAEEDWRGRHDWNQFKQKWEAEGVKLDWQSIVPPTVPDDQNFAFSPVWIAQEKFYFSSNLKRAEAWYGDRINSPEVDKFVSLMPVTTAAILGTNAWNYQSKTPDNYNTWQRAQFFDLKPWQTYYRDLGKSNSAVNISTTPQPQTPAQDVLLALSKFDPVFKQLHADSIRPYSRFPLGYDGEEKAAILLPHLAALKQMDHVLELRALAELREGESDQALADVKLMIHMANTVRNEPFLISHLVRIVMIETFTLQPVYEGLARHQWTDAQLAALNDSLADMDFLANYHTAIHGECVLENANIDYLRKSSLAGLNRMLGQLNQDMQLGSILMFKFGPAGWYDQNKRLISHFSLNEYLPIVNDKDETVSPFAISKAATAYNLTIRPITPQNYLAQWLLPDLSGTPEKFAYAQSSANLARVAIALERYRLAHGEYPEKLDSLTPQFITQLPHDVIGGQSLHYRRNNDGSFVLYSVGWNETDDGGVVVYRKESQYPSVDINQGDWVWRYPEK